MKKARFYKKLEDNLVECTACEWKCKIKPESLGICGVRRNKAGDLYSLVYGQVVDAYPDWIEKKKLAHFMPGTYAFSIGTVGCNFKCDFCLNWKSSQFPKLIKDKLRGNKVNDELDAAVSKYGYELSPVKIVDYCEKKNINIIAYTYNEPTVFIEFALDTAEIGNKSGIKSVFVTNGFMSESAAEELSESMAAVSFDLKSFSDDFYKRLCGGRLDPVLRNIEFFHKKGVWIEVTTLIIPGENDSDYELREIAEFLADLSPDIPWHITKFSPEYKMQNKGGTPSETLYKAFDIGKKAGLRYIYFGNLWDSDKTSTYCPNCGKMLIYRDIYDIRIEETFDTNGKCKSCGQKIAGVWK